MRRPSSQAGPVPSLPEKQGLRTIGIYIAPMFSMISLMCMIEPLRVVNEIVGHQLIKWQLLSKEGGRVNAINGLDLMAHRAISDDDRFDALAVCASYDLQNACDPRVLAWLRRLARGGMRVGAIDTGTYVLAKAGLLTGHRCTIHWQNLESFRAEFPDLQVTTNLFEIDRKRFSCSGATAALDLMLYLIGNEYGSELAMQVSEQLIYARLRHDHNGQRSSIAHRLQISDAKLSAALAVMDQEVEAPLVVAEVADRAGLTVRQMERLFERNLGCTPSRYYADLRLNRARTLLNQTTLSVIEIAEGCGFPSYAHFSRSYKRLFGHAPTAERMRHFDRVRA